MFLKNGQINYFNYVLTDLHHVLTYYMTDHETNTHGVGYSTGIIKVSRVFLDMMYLIGFSAPQSRYEPGPKIKRLKFIIRTVIFITNRRNIISLNINSS